MTTLSTDPTNSIVRQIPDIMLMDPDKNITCIFRAESTADLRIAKLMLALDLHQDAQKILETGEKMSPEERKRVCATLKRKAVQMCWLHPSLANKLAEVASNLGSGFASDAKSDFVLVPSPSSSEPNQS